MTDIDDVRRENESLRQTNGQLLGVELAQRRDEALVRALIEKSAEIVSLTTADGVTQCLTPLAAEHLGWTPEDIGSEVAALIQSKDWSKTPLGPPAGWSSSLTTVLRLMLSSRYSMWLGWGPQLTYFYNDAYAEQTLGPKHSNALGRPFAGIWVEVWLTLKTRIEHVLATGEATWNEGLLTAHVAGFR